MITITSSSVGEKRQLSGYAVRDIAIGTVVFGAGLLWSGAAVAGKDTTVRIKTISSGDQGVSLDPSSLQSEIEQLMPSLEELASMTTDLPQEWLEDTAWDDYERQ